MGVALPTLYLHNVFFLFFGFRVPLEDIEFDEDKCDQPQERIPEIQEAALESPICRTEKQDDVKESLGIFKGKHQLVGQLVLQLLQFLQFSLIL